MGSLSVRLLFQRPLQSGEVAVSVAVEKGKVGASETFTGAEEGGWSLAGPVTSIECWEFLLAGLVTAPERPQQDPSLPLDPDEPGIHA